MSLDLNAAGLIRATANTCLGKKRREEKKNNKASIEFIALQMSGK